MSFSTPRRHGTVAAVLALMVSLGLALPFQIASGADGKRAPRPPQSTVTRTVTATATVTATRTVTATATVTAPGPTVTATVPGPTVTVTASPASSASTTPTVSQTPTVTPTPTTTSPPPTGVPNRADWPDASDTGVPAGTALTTYTGPQTITVAGTVIDSVVVNSGLEINAPNVTIRKSRINGFVGMGSNGSLLIEDSEIVIGDRPGTGLGETNFTAVRVEVTGGNRSMNCYSDCTVRDSYVHGQYSDETGQAHESGIRMGANTTLVHNTIACDAPAIGDAGCSAGLTGYGDFNAVANNLIENNWFPTTPSGGTCAYGGASTGKAYSGQDHDIRFVNNVFEHGPTGFCGIWYAIYDFDLDRPGNMMSGNRYDDGKPIGPDGR